MVALVCSSLMSSPCLLTKDRIQIFSPKTTNSSLVKTKTWLPELRTITTPSSNKDKVSSSVGTKINNLWIIRRISRLAKVWDRTLPISTRWTPSNTTNSANSNTNSNNTARICLSTSRGIQGVSGTVRSAGTNWWPPTIRVRIIKKPREVCSCSKRGWVPEIRVFLIRIILWTTSLTIYGSPNQRVIAASTWILNRVSS